ncbi:hypothetical protein SAMN04490248_11968 [Salinihabitans flavidus]|uniref:AAA+ family ATPase n=1 Tax=Salinihabitans flavidus TaxID=569882 RepID=A0A1H8UDF9_9RHOB|nr:hypothetical protein [Salinihabitans flavidus]SEP01235.1 hypothetical protein SAMN04490248_11968 [Salinihabitans flavidus]
MKQILFAILLAIAPVAASAEEAEPEGFNLMEEGAKLFFRGLQKQMEPAMEDLRGLADEMEPALRGFMIEMGPALRDLMGKVEDWSAYHPPEILPNGDIIMRKKAPESPAPPAETEI